MLPPNGGETPRNNGETLKTAIPKMSGGLFHVLK